MQFELLLHRRELSDKNVFAFMTLWAAVQAAALAFASRAGSAEGTAVGIGTIAAWVVTAVCVAVEVGIRNNNTIAHKAIEAAHLVPEVHAVIEAVYEKTKCAAAIPVDSNDSPNACAKKETKGLAWIERAWHEMLPKGGTERMRRLVKISIALWSGIAMGLTAVLFVRLAATL